MPVEDNRSLVPKAKEEKKLYHRPKLEVYGNLRSIVQAVGQNAMLDGGSPPNKNSRV